MHIQNLQKGFSFIESIIAITILLVALVAPLSIATTSIKTAVFVREQLTATFLAQEGIELVMALRANSALTARVNNGSTLTDAWFGTVGDCTGNAGCGMDGKVTVFSCGGNINCFLYFSDTPSASNGYRYYSYDSNGIQSKYERVIRLEDISASSDQSEIKIEVTVNWDSDFTGDNNSVIVTSSIFDYHKFD